MQTYVVQAGMHVCACALRSLCAHACVGTCARAWLVPSVRCRPLQSICRQAVFRFSPRGGLWHSEPPVGRVPIAGPERPAGTLWGAGVG